MKEHLQTILYSLKISRRDTILSTHTLIHGSAITLRTKETDLEDWIIPLQQTLLTIHYESQQKRKMETDFL